MIDQGPGQRTRGALFVAMVAGLFALANAGYLHRLVTPMGGLSLIAIWMFEFVAFAVAYEIAVTLYASFASRPAPVPRCHPRHSRVALVCVTCDDVDPAVLGRLGDQRYPNLQVFILDDSQTAEAQAVVDALPFTVVRRLGREGFKAGNLNHWLAGHSGDFTYLVVADADSVLPPHFVGEMVAYAESPGYERVGILESTIQAWNTGSPFVRLQVAVSRINQLVRLRVDNALGTCLSVGHNNLYRLAALDDVGGFAAGYLAEDYATTITMAARRWRCAAVPVVSYERLPTNVTEYSRREARWAFQTFQLTSLSVAGLPFVLRLKLLMGLVHYAKYPLGAAALMLLAWSWTSRALFAPLDVAAVAAGSAVSIGRLSLFVSLVMLVPLLARLVLAVRAGVAVAAVTAGMVLHASLFAAALWPVVRRLLGARSPARRTFDVTGSSPAPTLTNMLAAGAPAYALIWTVTLLHIVDPGGGIPNLVWLVPSAIAPLFLHGLQRE